MDLKRMSRDSRKDWAVKQTKLRSDKNKAEIDNSVIKTKVYTDDTDILLPDRVESKITVLNNDTVTTLFNTAESKTGILNFASYKHPGGGFITGAVAQEEYLCWESDLYNVLKCFQDSRLYSLKETQNSLISQTF